MVLLLAALELGLYHAGDYGKWVVQERDRLLGWKMLPDQQRWSRDLTVPEVVNSWGFRDREWERAPTERDAGLFRVVVLGNSMTYGTSVPVEEVWTRVLEERLQERLDARGDGRRALVMNLAVQGYVFEQMFRCYLANAREVDAVRWDEDDPAAPPAIESSPRLRPDLVIVPTLPHDAAPMMPGSDDADYLFRDAVLRSATHDMLVDRVIDKWIPKPRPAASAAVARRLAAIAAADRAMQEKPWADANRAHWARAEARMAELRDLVEADGGRLLLVNLPVKHPLLHEGAPTTTVRWGPWAAAQNRLPERPAVVQVEPLEAFRAAMPDLLPLLREGGIVPDERGGQRLDPGLPHLDESVFLESDLGHYSARGHRILAERVCEAVVREGLLD